MTRSKKIVVVDAVEQPVGRERRIVGKLSIEKNLTDRDIEKLMEVKTV